MNKGGCYRIKRTCYMILCPTKHSTLRSYRNSKPPYYQTPFFILNSSFLIPALPGMKFLSCLKKKIMVPGQNNQERTMPPAQTGNASNPSPKEGTEPASNQLIDERGEKYL